MTKQEALSLVKQVIAQYKGTRQEHALLQQAEQQLMELIKPESKKEPKE